MLKIKFNGSDVAKAVGFKEFTKEFNSFKEAMEFYNNCTFATEWEMVEE